MSKKLYELEVGALPGREVDHLVIGLEVRKQCQLFDRSNDERHLWRAWRAARSAGTISPACLEWLMPRLDKLAQLPDNETRAEQHEERTSRLRDYYYEVVAMEEQRPGCAKSLAAIRRKVAERHDITEGALKQMIMEFEGRGQRGKNR